MWPKYLENRTLILYYVLPLRRPKRSIILGARASARATRRGASAMCKDHKKRCKGLRIFQIFKRQKMRPLHQISILVRQNMWPLHTSEALAHIQVALAPISI